MISKHFIYLFDMKIGHNKYCYFVEAQSNKKDNLLRIYIWVCDWVKTILLFLQDERVNPLLGMNDGCDHFLKI